ncbi:MAG: adenosylmethionine-8-amino-7-oxononanoate aminotransferase [Planctomycetota bacterium]|jgi:adenosylmethionine-8-amino-7-oxononanoate aminotransferase|uniref:adenosylmethionine--8-amino-7-oxononanoate transaminase n=1 Tax=Patiriisocius sp. Uisw_047 TaxID=3230969 RepID=UPI0039E7B7A1
MKLTQRDKAHLWHPLTQHKTASAPLAIVKSKGALLWDEDGKEYIDGIASWYTSMYGHCNEYITAAITKQMQELDFVMFSGLTHKPAIELSEKLMEILPSNQAKIFFNDNGSTAVEAAIKMALQFHHNGGEKRDTLIAFENGFHGDTFGAMSASGIASYNAPFEDFLLKVERIPVPTDDTLAETLNTLDQILQNNKCAAFLFEPLAQGAAGMKFHTAAGLDALIKKCQEHQVLCVADEIMTGFGKTGTNFACDQLTQQPDIMCLSKALTAGLFPLSITSCSKEIYDAFLSDDVHKAFFHAHTFSAHPLGCAAAIAGLDLLNSPEIIYKRNWIEECHQAFVAKIKKHPKVKNARSKGVILAIDLAIDMDRYGSVRDELYQFFLERGLLIRPLGSTIYLLPPYVITEEELEKCYSMFEEVLNSFKLFNR